MNQIIEQKFQQLKGDVEYFMMGGNQNMVNILVKQVEKLIQLEKEIAYFVEGNNQNMVKLLIRDVQKLG